MTLAELEHYFAAAATSGTGPVAGLDRVFLGDARLSASARLAIYNRAYFYRLLDALASVFSASKRALGEVEFERTGLAYVARHPSDHPALERVGRHFSAYLAQVAACPPWIVDLAALEWARLCALVAPNPPRLAQPLELDSVRFPNCSLEFVPALSWLEIDARALSAWSGEASSQETAERCGVVIFRAGYNVHHDRLLAANFQALGAATGGATLSHVCAAFDTGDVAGDAQRAFQVISSWFARHWVQCIHYPEP